MFKTKEDRKDILYFRAIVGAEDAVRRIEEIRDELLSDQEKYGVEGTMEVIRLLSVEEVDKLETLLSSAIDKMKDLKGEMADLFHKSRKIKKEEV